MRAPGFALTGLAVAALSFATVTSVAAEDPPALLPPSPPSHVAAFQVEAAAPAQYEQTLTMLDFEPNAWTMERRHDGMAFFSVVEGAVTVRKDGKDSIYTRGQSVGKQACSSRIVGIDGQRAPLVRAVVLRTWAPLALPMLPWVGGLLAAVDVLFVFRRDRRCLHDLVAGTRVVRTDWPPP